MPSKILIATITLFSCILLSPTLFADANEDAQQARIEKFVADAINEIKTKGKATALSEFNASQGPFMQDETYIFALNYEGMLLANPNNLEMVGKVKPEIRDKNGKNITRDLIDKAKSGGGWVSYFWKNPSTQKVACKMSFVMPAGHDYLVGSGYYTSDDNCM